MSGSTEVARQTKDLTAFCKRFDMVADRVLENTPAHLRKTDLASNYKMAVSDNHALLECTEMSLFRAFKEAATMGLHVGGRFAKAYLVPFRNQKKRQKEAQLFVKYTGIIDMWRRSGEVSNIEFDVVHAGDRFEHHRGSDSRIDHRASDDPERESRPITHVYLIVSLKNGSCQLCSWSAAKINAHKERFARGWEASDSPWQLHWETMAFKTLVHYLAGRGLVPMSRELSRVLGDSLPPVVESDCPTVIESGSEEKTPEADQLESIMDSVDDAEQQWIQATEAVDAATTIAEVNAAINDHLEGMDEPDIDRLRVYADARRKVIHTQNDS